MRIFLAFILLFLCAVPVFAETVHLKDGNAITGKILERNAKSVKVDVDGTAMTYYADEIQDIDGTALTAAVPPAAPTPAAQTAPAVEMPAPAAVSSAPKKDLILKFIDVFGTRAAMSANLEAMLKSLPEGAETQKLKENIKVDEIIERLIPIYDKQFSESDLKAFIDFYSSSAGRTLVAGIPVIMRDSVEVSSQYLQEKFPEMKQKDNKN